MAPAYFTFSEPAWEPSTDEEDEYTDKVTPEVRGYLEVGYLGASDSRVSGRLTSVTNMNMLDVEGGGVATGASSMRLVNDGGAWSGTSQGLRITQLLVAGVAEGDRAMQTVQMLWWRHSLVSSSPSRHDDG